MQSWAPAKPRQNFITRRVKVVEISGQVLPQRKMLYLPVIFIWNSTNGSPRIAVRHTKKRSFTAFWTFFPKHSDETVKRRQVFCRGWVRISHEPTRARKVTREFSLLKIETPSRKLNCHGKFKRPSLNYQDDGCLREKHLNAFISIRNRLPLWSWSSHAEAQKKIHDWGVTIHVSSSV